MVLFKTIYVFLEIKIMNYKNNIGYRGIKNAEITYSGNFSYSNIMIDVTFGNSQFNSIEETIYTNNTLLLVEETRTAVTAIANILQLYKETELGRSIDNKDLLSVASGMNKIAEVVFRKNKELINE